MSKIVIATDGSEAAGSATETGLQLARQTGDEVLFISVWSVIQSAFGAPYGNVDELIDADKSRAREVLRDAEKRAAELGVTATAELVQGNPTSEICKAAEDNDARMIVIGSHGWSSFRGFLSGSVVGGVLEHAKCPVLCGTPASRKPAHSG